MFASSRSYSSKREQRLSSRRRGSLGQSDADRDTAKAHALTRRSGKFHDEAKKSAPSLKTARFRTTSREDQDRMRIRNFDGSQNCSGCEILSPPAIFWPLTEKG